LISSSGGRAGATVPVSQQPVARGRRVR